ncbi:protein kinase domain-containing protein [Ditylenchus destructor]|uniref:Protein kinase domain-containing protein n=1 Tax=Ditylenchus destructor TaxID=166010 RepID=A0AAD4MIU1_9BILA|nr:protein kinase domain-containing protein [Ditylenchus destructor]
MISSASTSQSDKPLDNYSDFSKIGKGGFGVVFRAKNRLGQVVAIKRISKHKGGKRVEEEIRVLKRLNTGSGHHRIVKFFESFSDEEYTYIVMEYCERGTLKDYIKQNGHLDKKTAADVLSQLIEGVSIMHKNEIMHRDLTASNVLISRVTNGRLFVKISDFGLTKKTPLTAAHGTCLGTPGYIAPQVRERQAYGKQADVYSLGAILYVMLNGTEPGSISWDSQGNPEFTESLKDKLDNRALDALKAMMCRYESKRITLEELDQHPFISLAHASRLQEMRLQSPAAGISNKAVLADSGRGTASGYNTRWNNSRHPVATNNNVRRDCAFDMSLMGNDTLRGLTHVPMIDHMQASLPTHFKSQTKIGSKFVTPYASTIDTNQNSRKSLLYAWPIPDVRHLVYMSVNTFGRFAIRSDIMPSMVYEMADTNGNIKLIFELYNNTVPNKQRLLIYKPARIVPVPEKYERFVEKKFESELRIRSVEELTRASSDIQMGYKRLWQFINLAKAKVSQCGLRNAFGYAGFNIDMKYNGTIELNFHGIKATQSSKGELNASELNDEEILLFKCGIAKLHQVADNKIYEQLSTDSKTYAQQYLDRPFLITWAKTNI